MTEETKKKISESRRMFFKNGGIHPLKGKKHTLETKEKISKSLTGDKHPQWKGGKIKSSNGYVWVWCPDNPMANTTSPIGYVLEHRLVMSNKIGRPLNKKEIVHHLNGVRDDNRIENLVLMTNSEHTALHNKQRICDVKTRELHRQKIKKMKRDSKGRIVKN